MADEKKVDIFLPLYVGDYLADTRELSAEEHGAYLLLLMGAWRRGGRLPTDPVLLSRMASVPSQRWKKVWGMISRFFVLVDGELEQPRLIRELTKAGRFNRAASIAGLASARARLERDGTNRPKTAKRHGPTTNDVREPLDESFGSRSVNAAEDPHSHSHSHSDPGGSERAAEPDHGPGYSLLTMVGLVWAVRREVEKLHPELGLYQPGYWANRAAQKFIEAIPLDRRAPSLEADILRRIKAFAASEDLRITKGKWTVDAFCEAFNSLAPAAPPPTRGRREMDDLPQASPRPSVLPIAEARAARAAERTATSPALTGAGSSRPA